MNHFHPDPKPDYFAQKMARKANLAKDKVNADRSHNFFFKSVWNTNPHKCFECGIPIPVYNKRYLHHCIEKHLQKYYTRNLDDTENGMILCLEHHDQCRLDLDKVLKVKAKTIELLKIYEPFLTKK